MVLRLDTKANDSNHFSEAAEGATEAAVNSPAYFCGEAVLAFQTEAPRLEWLGVCIVASKQPGPLRLTAVGLNGHGASKGSKLCCAGPSGRPTILRLTEALGLSWRHGALEAAGSEETFNWKAGCPPNPSRTARSEPPGRYRCEGSWRCAGAAVGWEV